jgi:nitric oxide dioxygenase
LYKFDVVDAFAAVLLAIGTALFLWGMYLEPPGSINELISSHFGDWSPGFVIDGLLLLVINRVIRSNERKRVISQVGSLSNEFALDAVRRCREESWLVNGIMERQRFAKARLSTADLSGANLAGTDFSFADLSMADLTHSDLQEAVLTGANLAGSDLRWADLRGANLQWSDLRNTQQYGAILGNVNATFAAVDPEQATNPAFRDAVAGGLLSEHQTELVQTSFESLLSLGDSAIVRFYEKLFDTAPELREMFSPDIDRQARKFLQSLKLIVTSLSSTERAAPVLQRLGERHRQYGVQAVHYDVVGSVLIETLDELLADASTDEVLDAWKSAFRLISSIMNSEGQ